MKLTRPQEELWDRINEAQATIERLKGELAEANERAENFDSASKSEALESLEGRLHKHAAYHHDQARGASWEFHVRTATDIQDAANELAALRAENERLKAELREAYEILAGVELREANAGDAEGREEAAAELRAENERLKGELAAYEAQAQSEQTTVLDSWMRRCNELECERNRLDGELRDAQATIERLKGELAEANERAENFDSALAVAKNSREYNRCRAEKAEAQLREAQATIERVREAKRRWDWERKKLRENDRRDALSDCSEAIESALASAKQEQEVRS